MKGNVTIIYSPKNEPTGPTISHSFDTYSGFGEWIANHLDDIKIESIKDEIKNLPAEGVDLASKPDQTYLELKIGNNLLLGDKDITDKFVTNELLKAGFDLDRPIEHDEDIVNKQNIFRQRR